MDVHAAIVDQQVRRAVDEHGEALAERGRDTPERRRSNAFCLLCVKSLLGLDDEPALDCLTDGFQDGGVDAIHYSEVVDGEFVVTLFQAKYDNKLEGNCGFESEAVLKLVSTIQAVFDPSVPLHGMEDIRPHVEEIRSLIRDGGLPQVRAVLCNNGKKWEADAQNRIDMSGLAKSGQVAFEHLNHVRLLDLMKKPIEIEDTLQLDGAAVVEAFNFRRVLIGKVGVRHIEQLVERHSDLLFEKNIRRYLGWHNRVNQGMYETLADKTERQNFYFYNNGVTMICHKFSHNNLQKENWMVKVSGLQIINGGQTCKTIHHWLSRLRAEDFSQAFVLVRLYELDNANASLAYRITGATNNQSPIELRDLRSNDDEQVRLAKDLELLGYEYKSKRDSGTSGSKTIPSSVAAEAVLAIWRRCPHQAKFASGKLFDQLYTTIFTSKLTGAQVVLAALIYRIVHNERRKPRRTPPYFLPYASHHLAMICGQLLLKESNLRSDDVSHLNFTALFEKWQRDQGRIYDLAVEIVSNSLTLLAVNAATNLQRVSAQFRRGDLIDFVEQALDRVLIVNGEAVLPVQPAVPPPTLPA
ncbi:MAG: AIPR family protein [Planctomycetes bacterium]|nr:AIPR family protein [Planctomycetota bacterium]